LVGVRAERERAVFETFVVKAVRKGRRGLGDGKEPSGKIIFPDRIFFVLFRGGCQTPKIKRGKRV